MRRSLSGYGLASRPITTLAIIRQTHEISVVWRQRLIILMHLRSPAETRGTKLPLR
jgi:hypothetical protein